MNASIGNVEICGFEESVKASKYPFLLNTSEADGIITTTTDKLATSSIGSGEDNFLNGIVVQFDLTFSNKAWVEMQRYHFIDFVSSQSTMHCLSKFNIADRCNDYVDSRIIEILKEKVDTFNQDKSRKNFLHMIYNVPSGFMLTARMTTNYRQLKTIYKQRRHHRLQDWQLFCDWIETLPYSDWITGGASDE